MKKWIYILVFILFSACKTVYLTYDTPLKEYDFTKSGLEEWYVNNNTFYNDNSTLFLKDNINQTSEGLILSVHDSTGIAETWMRKDTFFCTGANMATWSKGFDGFTFTSPCTIEIEAKVSDSWAAFWLLHVPRIRPETGRTHSIPEIDIVENNGNRIDFWVHYGYDKVKYNRYSWGKPEIHVTDGKYHRYAVKITKDMYEYYFDGKRLKTLKNKSKFNQQFIDNSPMYLILTNAIDDRFTPGNYDFVIKWIKIYK